MKANCCQIFGEMPFAMTSFLTTAPPPPPIQTGNGRRGVRCSPMQRSRIIGRHVSYVEQIGIGRYKESGTFY